MEQFNSVVNQNLGWVHTNKYVLPVVSVVLAVYVAMLRPKLPPSVERVFSNPVFRLVVLSYIAFRDTNEPVLSVMMAVAFLVTMYMIDKQSSENFPVGDSCQPNCGGAAGTEGFTGRGIPPCSTCIPGR